MAYSPNKKKSSRIYKCAVNGCENNSWDHSNLTFHSFPNPQTDRHATSVYISDWFGNMTKVDQLTAWLHALKIKYHTKGMRVCSKHFKKEDYSFPDVNYHCKRQLLIKTAVPSLNLPVADKVKDGINKERLKRRLRREALSNFTVDQLAANHSFVDVNVANDNENILSQEENVIVHGRDDYSEMDSSELVSDDSVLIPETVYGNVPDETVPCISSCVGEHGLENSDSLQLFLMDTFQGENIALAHDGSEECPDGFLVIDESTFNMEHVNGQNRVSVDGIDAFEAQSLSYVDNAVSNSSQQNHVDDLSGMNTSHQPFDESSESNVATKSCSCTCKCFEASADVTNQARVGQGSPKQDAAVQVDHKYSVLDMLRTDQQLSSATGIESFKLLDIIVNCMRTATDHKYEKKNIIMDTRKRVIMTYVKIKHNISYRFLSLVFGSIITEQHCGRIFVQTILMLNKIMKAIALPWPTRETIKRNLPQCFEGFENNRIVLDCTEIFIQKPQNLCCRIQVYSNYKGGDTIKLMTGVSLEGTCLSSASLMVEGTVTLLFLSKVNW
ncbi:hypothetical protein QAD02_016549 [Eretmocerus hayati]|uniref:Uncharacterized protein n=1 Tax=Eretmocerus hayati TaxID=131215 RepID=A0ACC2PBE6_9HYME|nr:hypothetical protein QAD02_016549 [Eretmocerus hayati]